MPVTHFNCAFMLGKTLLNWIYLVGVYYIESKIILLKTKILKRDLSTLKLSLFLIFLLLAGFSRDSESGRIIYLGNKPINP